MQDAIDKRNERERIAHSIVKRWNVHYMSEEEILAARRKQQDEQQAQEILDNATMDANTIRVGAIQYTDDLLANAESIIGHTLDSYTTKYDGLINSLQECYDTVRSNRSELEVPSDDGYYDENGQGDLM